MSSGRERSGIKPKNGKLVAVEVDGERLVIDNQAMTIRERQMARAELSRIVDPDDIDRQVASIWIAMRRNDESLTFDDVCERLTLADVETAELVEDDTSPEA